MNTKTLKDLFLAELADMYDAEKRIVKALPRMAEAATCTDLKKAMGQHLQETQGHVTKVEEVFQCFGVPAKGQTCEATKGLIEEAEEIAAEFKGSPAIDAALIGAAQKVEHYEMASYGCLKEWATLLGNPKAARILEGILNEEGAVNKALTKLAVEMSNQKALGETSASVKGAELKGAADKKAAKPASKERPMAQAAR